MTTDWKDTLARIQKDMDTVEFRKAPISRPIHKGNQKNKKDFRPKHKTPKPVISLSEVFGYKEEEHPNVLSSDYKDTSVKKSYGVVTRVTSPTSKFKPKKIDVSRLDEINTHTNAQISALQEEERGEATSSLSRREVAVLKKLIASAEYRKVSSEGVYSMDLMLSEGYFNRKMTHEFEELGVEFNSAAGFTVLNNFPVVAVETDSDDEIYIASKMRTILTAYNKKHKTSFKPLVPETANFITVGKFVFALVIPARLVTRGAVSSDGISWYFI